MVFKAGLQWITVGVCAALFSGVVSAADGNLKLKAALTAVVDPGKPSIYRSEFWVKDKALSTDVKLKFENKNGRLLQKHRIQYMPLKIHSTAFGLAYRYKEKQGSDSVDALGFAARLRGEHWKVPVRYYPELDLFHSKPMVKMGRVRLDCQLIFDRKKHSHSVRPGIDWSVTPLLRIGGEARFYDDSDKNYAGLRLVLTAEN